MPPDLKQHIQRARSRVLILGIFLCSTPVAGAFTFAPTTSTSALTSSNTSAPPAWTGVYGGKTNGDAAVGNVSKEPIPSLLTGSQKVIAEMQSWFCVSGSTDPRCTNHIHIGYNSADPSEVQAQVNDELSRGISGLVTDWYGSQSLQTEALNNLDPIARATNGKFTYGVMIDKGYFSCSDTTTCTSEAISGINYVLSQWGGSPAYMKDSGNNPLIFWFINNFTFSVNKSTPIIKLIDWNQVNANVSGTPKYIFYEKGGLSATDTSGAFAWVSPTDGNSGFNDLSSFFTAALQHQTELIYGAGYKGFNDALASWGTGRVIDQKCGQTWLDVFAFHNANYLSKGGKLAALMLDTWDDYEEGTEIESGIDNCLNDVSVSTATGGVVNWSPAFGTDPLNASIVGTEKTVHHYSVYLALHGQGNVMDVQDLSCGAGTCPHSFNLSSLGITGGPYDVYVQAVGQPSIKNNLSATPALFSPSTVVPPAKPTGFKFR